MDFVGWKQDLEERHLDAEHERGRAGGYGQEGWRRQWEEAVSAGAEQSPKRRWEAKMNFQG